jgi:hypothetical protein
MALAEGRRLIKTGVLTLSNSLLPGEPMLPEQLDATTWRARQAQGRQAGACGACEHGCTPEALLLTGVVMVALVAFMLVLVLGAGAPAARSGSSTWGRGRGVRSMVARVWLPRRACPAARGASAPAAITSGECTARAGASRPHRVDGVEGADGGLWKGHRQGIIGAVF